MADVLLPGEKSRTGNFWAPGATGALSAAFDVVARMTARASANEGGGVARRPKNARSAAAESSHSPGIQDEGERLPGAAGYQIIARNSRFPSGLSERGSGRVLSAISRNSRPTAKDPVRGVTRTGAAGRPCGRATPGENRVKERRKARWTRMMLPRGWARQARCGKAVQGRSRRPSGANPRCRNREKTSDIETHTATHSCCSAVIAEIR